MFDSMTDQRTAIIAVQGRCPQETLAAPDWR